MPHQVYIINNIYIYIYIYTNRNDVFALLYPVTMTSTFRSKRNKKSKIFDKTAFEAAKNYWLFLSKNGLTIKSVEIICYLTEVQQPNFSSWHAKICNMITKNLVLFNRFKVIANKPVKLIWKWRSRTSVIWLKFHHQNSNGIVHMFAKHFGFWSNRYEDTA